MTAAARHEWDKEMTADFSPDGRGLKIVEELHRVIREGKTI